MNDCAKGKILLAIIMGEILILTSCGLQERGGTHNSAEIGKTGWPIPTDMIEDTQSEDGEAAEASSEMAEATSETAEAAIQILADLDMSPLYVAFLRSEISVPNPFVPDSELGFYDDREYAQVEHVFENAAKSFSLVDVNRDGVSELIFRIYSSPDELMYILGIQGDGLACYDVQETHTTHMDFQIYDNGIVMWGQNYDGEEEIYYSYDNDGKPYELIHFVREETDSGAGLYYDWYYRDGDENAKCALRSNEEYEALISSYEGGHPEWFSCDSFADIPVE